MIKSSELSAAPTGKFDQKQEENQNRLVQPYKKLMSPLDFRSWGLAFHSSLQLFY